MLKLSVLGHVQGFFVKMTTCSRGDICEEEQNVGISKFLFWEFKCCPLYQKGKFFINLFLKAKAN